MPLCPGSSPGSSPSVTASGGDEEPSETETGSEGAPDGDGLLATTDDGGTREVAQGGAVAVLHDATAAAQTAAALAAGDDAPESAEHHSRGAVVTTAAVTVGWVGDSRAYWVPDAGTPGGPSCLTVDDTLAGQLDAAGVAIADDAPSAGALLRWLGADATDTEPHIADARAARPGRVLVCSDGLYRYVPGRSELAALTPAGTADRVASALVPFALDAGGHDNVTVVVLPVPSGSGAHARRRFEPRATPRRSDCVNPDQPTFRPRCSRTSTCPPDSRWSTRWSP